jgi:hypothetical protein
MGQPQDTSVQFGSPPGTGSRATSGRPSRVCASGITRPAAPAWRGPTGCTSMSRRAAVRCARRRCPPPGRGRDLRTKRRADHWRRHGTGADNMARTVSRCDSHDLIRVRAHARTTSRTSASSCPKRRLTVFTGVSGSGKSSWCSARSRRSRSADQRDLQRLPAGLHARRGGPDVDLLEGLTTAIIVDQERMGPTPGPPSAPPPTSTRCCASSSAASAAAHRLAAGLLVQRRLDQRRGGGDGRTRVARP